MKREPVLILELVKAIVTAAIAFGAKLTAEQAIALYVVVAAILSVITRSRVSPA